MKIEIRFANARRRGVVVAIDVEAPEGVEPAAIERVLEELPPALVDLALWLADYYGSTPARAFGLVAPEYPSRRGERRNPGAAAGLPAEPAPTQLSDTQETALARLLSAGIYELRYTDLNWAIDRVSQLAMKGN